MNLTLHSCKTDSRVEMFQIFIGLIFKKHNPLEMSSSLREENH